jgi:hypothetical protein
VSVLVSGRFRIDLPDRSVVLAEPGDYIVFRGVNHTWQAEEASVVVSVRWPSLPGFDRAEADADAGTPADTDADLTAKANTDVGPDRRPGR